MAGTINPTGFKIFPSAVNCPICNDIAAPNPEELPRCPQCGSSYCRNCLRKREPQLRCAGDPAHCPLKLPFSDLPSAAV
jgi:ssDNA-binding Zn-finger/Zn-ribbon topoisomerase 1